MRSPWSAEQDDIILGVPPARDEGTWDRLAEEDAVAAGLVGSGAGDVSGTQEIVAAGLRATQPDELPLWEEQGIGPSEPGEAADRAGLPDLKAQLREVVEAWREIVPDGSSSADDLRVALEADVQALQVRWQNIAATPAAPAVATVKGVTASATAGRSAEAVNAALRDADRSHPALRDLAEWREIRAVREAVGRLWGSLTTKAGESVHRLLADRRVSEFLRSASIHACERIAQLAQQGADFLRARQGSLPTAEALLALGETASAYGASARRQASLPTAEALLSSGATLQPVPRSSPPSSAVDVPGLRRMGQALERPGPAAAQTRRVSANAAKARSVGQPPRRSAAGVGEQPAHLRRGGAPVQPGRTPKQP
ncbi:hypothetical protein ACFVXG_01465 [Kitasatospora sp. NPDC058162]|uniref:hypothetical protein n=1 Tax=Kitasatospora sp. NPDC058162 TaxID=3346362 RepID=UPI0036DF4106